MCVTYIYEISIYLANKLLFILLQTEINTFNFWHSHSRIALTVLGSAGGTICNFINSRF